MSINTAASPRREFAVRLVVPPHGAEVLVTVQPGACVADLAGALGLDPATPLWTGGRWWPAATALADVGLVDGDVVATEPAPAPYTGRALGSYVFEVIGGVHSGRRIPLTHGRQRVGRDPAGDITLSDGTVSFDHAELTLHRNGEVTIADAGSRNGTWLDGQQVRGPAPLRPAQVVRTGAALWRAGPERTGDRVDPVPAVPGTSTRPWNRPPLLEMLPEGEPIVLPQPPPDADRTSAFAVAPIAGSVLLAAVLVGFTGHVVYALTAALGPLLTVGGAIEGRRRHRIERRRHRRRFEADLHRLEAALAGAAMVERDRLRTALPDLAEVVRRAVLPSARLWERRPQHPEFLRLRVGSADLAWRPGVEGPAPRHPEVVRILAGTELRAAPVAVDLRAGAVGIAGDRQPALAVARSFLLQAAVHHGPADLTIEVDAADPSPWSWARWLPHGGPPDRQRVHLRVIDGVESPAPLPPDGSATAIVIADRREQLPAWCSTTVELLGPDGEAILGARSLELLADGLDTATAAAAARAIAGFHDPCVDPAAWSPPASIRLTDLLGLAPGVDGAGAALAVAERWRACDGLAAPIGVTATGPWLLDLVTDGPHGLIAGTTGSGKSELLRTLICSFAASVPPEQLNFALIDFKGGSAFDACAALPHVAGVVTDLDGHLAGRVLRSLEAEVRRREALLRAAAAPDLASYRRRHSDIAALVVVVDEFATLRAELPAFVDALVGLAQRGRSLGIHLLLATQRPAGIVSDQIRANSSLRICLALADEADGADVLGAPLPARLAGDRPGRAWFRTTARSPELAQVATAGVAARLRPPAVTVVPIGAPVDEEPGEVTELERIVCGVCQAAAARGSAPPHRPWLDPLPAMIEPEDLPTSCEPDALVLGLADDPDSQRHEPYAWSPSAGNLLVAGGPGSGTADALLAVALAGASAHPPEELHLYGIAPGGRLGGVESLPHTGAVIAPSDRERLARLIGRLRHQIRERTVGGLRSPSILVLIESWPALAAELGDAEGLELLDELIRVLADGPSVGVSVVITADRPGAIPLAVSASLGRRLYLRLADPHEYAVAGSDRPARERGMGAPLELPEFRPGLGLAVDTGRWVQLAHVGAGRLAAVTGRWPPADLDRCAAPIRSLPTTVHPGGLPRPRAGIAGAPWFIPLGLGARDLGPTGFTLHRGEHALIAGPPRCGRSSALRLIEETCRTAGIPALLLEGATGPDPTAVAAALARLDGAGAALLLVDDADYVDDGGLLAPLLSARDSPIRVIAAARADVVRTAYQHWVRTARRRGPVLLLGPPSDLDAELAGRPLPRRSPVPPGPGRGWLVDGGDADVVQVAKIDKA